MKLTFIGDICLGRYVRERYESCSYQLVSPDLIDKLTSSSGKVFANLESPIADDVRSVGLRFAGITSMLQQFTWVDCFSLANNHINDLGENGMTSTVESLHKLNLCYNGLFAEEYEPYLINDGDSKVAVFCCADKVNHKIVSSKYQLLFVESELLHDKIKDYRSKGYFVIVYAHMGSMFCRYPNPSVKNTIHKLIDYGVGCIFVSHPHCVGGVYKYKEVPVFYSLGDFLMDGESFRRRRSCSVSIKISENKIVGWDFIPSVTGIDLQTHNPNEKEKRKIDQGIRKVTESMSLVRMDYKKYYKYRYKFDMICHSFSTINFIFRTKGFFAIIHSFASRLSDFRAMYKRIAIDRTNIRNG